MHKATQLVGLKAGPTDGLEDGQFTAYASVFGNVDSYGDVVVKGAFADSLAEWETSGNALPLLFGHNMSDPDFNVGHIIEAKEDDHGLWVKAQIDMESPKAAQTYRLLKTRRLSQLSFAYDELDAAPAERDGEEVYELRKLKLYEVSVVPIGANQETELLAVKAAADVARGLAVGVKEGRVLAVKHMDSLRSARDAIDAVLTAAGAEDDREKDGGNGDGNDEGPGGVKSEDRDRRAATGVLAAQVAIDALA